MLMFLTHHNLQGSQTMDSVLSNVNSFLPIIIYKVLKRGESVISTDASFLPIIIYKVLKPQILLKLSPNLSVSQQRNYEFDFILLSDIGLCQQYIFAHSPIYLSQSIR